MKRILSVQLLIITTSISIFAQAFELISECSDTFLLRPINRVIILEPYVKHDVQVIKTTIVTTIENEIHKSLRYKYLEVESYSIKTKDFIAVNLRDIIQTHKDFDAILVTEHYLFTRVNDKYATSREEYNYSLIRMRLYDIRCELLAEKTFQNMTGDSYGMTRKPLKGIESATRKSICAVLDEISDINKERPH